MNGAAWLLALATLGVDYGWQLDKDGQLEYIIQIPPTQLETLRDRPEGISSSIPPEVVRHVKRFRIVVGSEPLPKDPLPTFPAEGNVTPINVDASRVNPAGADLPLGGNDLSSGFETPALESTVTPLDDTGVARTDLPGPAPEIPGDPADAVDSILPMPPIPRAADRGLDFGSLAAVTPRAVIRQGQLDSDLRPNVNAPDVSDTWNMGTDARNSFDDRAASYSEPSNADAPNRRTPSRRNGNDPFSTNDPFGTRTAKEPMYPPLAATILALCFSIGGNVYLGWIAWGYYMKYRETFESWRGWTSSQ
jgi:hypothetical protein